jgi:hypothetical protein
MIDREEVLRVAYENSTIVKPAIWYPLYKGLIDPYLKAIYPLLEKYDTYEYNPKKAEEILTGLGFERGADGVWVTPEGIRLELTILVPAPWIEKRRWGAVVADQLREGGIDAVLKIVEVGPFGDALMSGMFDAVTIWSCPGDTDVAFTLENWHSKFWRPVGVPAPGWHANIERYKNPEYDEIVDEIMMTHPAEVDKIVGLFKSAMEILIRDLVPGPMVAQARKLIPFDTYYWIGWPSADNPWIHPADWWGSFLLTILGYKSPKTGEWVGGIRPREVDYVTVYFTKDTPKSRGIDLTWYGPFSAGDSASVPVDDAEFWIRKGYASYTPIIPTPPVPPEIPAIAEAVEDLLGDVAGLTTELAAVSGDVTALLGEMEALRGQMSMLMVVAVVEGIAIIALAIALIMVRRKPA